MGGGEVNLRAGVDWAGRSGIKSKKYNCMIFKIDETTIEIVAEQNGLRISSNHGDYSFTLMGNAQQLKSLIGRNYPIVKDHYWSKSGSKIELKDIQMLSAKILLNPSVINQLWVNIYGDKRYREEEFLERFYNDPIAYDLIISYFKHKDLGGYTWECAILLDMTIEEVLAYEKRRQAFWDMW